jgi:hypothetical protein
MSRSVIIPFVLKRAGLCAVLALLGGCETAARQALIEVSSPPTPRVGSQRIVAYDAYAAALFGAADSPATVTASGDATATAPAEKRPAEATLD